MKYYVVSIALVGVTAGCFLFERGQMASEQQRLNARLEALERERREPVPSSEKVVERTVVVREAPASGHVDEAQDEDASTAHDKKNARLESMTQADIDHYWADQFRTDKADSTWAPTAAREIRAAIDSELPPGSTVLSFECRSSGCQLEVEHATFSENNGLIGRLYQSADSAVSQNTAGIISTEGQAQPNGRMRFTVFFRKSGTSLVPE